MATPETSALVLDLILYVMLPLWGLSGFADWVCHRASGIERTSGLKESVLHAVMGVQVGIPIVLCVLYDVNVTILLVCVAALVLHEVVAHLDVRTAAPLRDITIWEVHAHNFLATIPFYTFALIAVLRWDTVTALLHFDFEGWGFHRHEVPVGGPSYLPGYLAFMAVVCGFPYLEELIRCARAGGRRHA